MPDRFDRLEPSGELPAAVRAAVEKLTRFDHLEIGPQREPPDAAPERRASTLCLRCGQANEREREVCWACAKPLTERRAVPAAAVEQDITIVLDGQTYRSTDPALPEDVKTLIARIRKEGYSPELLADWRSWRATRRSHEPRTAREAGVIDDHRGEDEEEGVKVFRGQRVSVIRLDGKVYTSDDPGLSDEMKVLFQYIEDHGVTPELMDTLRARGRRVKYRPPTTAAPSDGDLAFWRAAAREDPGSLELKSAELMAEARRETEEEKRRRVKIAALCAAAILILLVKLARCG